MIEAALLERHEVPEGFICPPPFQDMISREILVLYPWEILIGKHLRRRKDGLDSRCPERRLVPFAARADNDDVACWQGRDTRTVVIIHDFASPGWELRRSHESFEKWLRAAFEDMIDYLLL